jgi:hypothetical protein
LHELAVVYGKHREETRIEYDFEVLTRILVQNDKTRRLADNEIAEHVAFAAVDRAGALADRNRILAHDLEFVVANQNIDEKVFRLALGEHEVHVSNQNVLRIDDLGRNRPADRQQNTRCCQKGRQPCH